MHTSTKLVGPFVIIFSWFVDLLKQYRALDAISRDYQNESTITTNWLFEGGSIL